MDLFRRRPKVEPGEPKKEADKPVEHVATPSDVSKVDVEVEGHFPKIENRFPNIELLDPNDKSVHRDRIPAVARQKSWNSPGDQQGSDDELIWLTPDAAKERLETILLTHPDFNERGFSHVAGSEALEMIEQAHGGRRAPKTEDEVIDVLIDQGFQVVTNFQGEKGIVIDATIPSKDNTSGRIVKREVHQEGDAVISVWVPEEPNKSGLRPVTNDTKNGIFVPLDWIIGVSKGPGFKERRGGFRSHPAKHAESVSGLFGTEAFTVREALVDLFDRKDEIGSKIRAIFNKEQVRENGEQRSRLEFYDLLTKELGLRPKLANTGYFPNEPVFELFAEPLEARKRVMIDCDTEGKTNPGAHRFTLYLEELWYWLYDNQDHRRYWKEKQEPA
ncbi:MAG: hypothetical protein WA057_05410 [Candidatus Magasanikiibacteriota bacterium]